MDIAQGFPSTVNLTMKQWPRAKWHTRPILTKPKEPKDEKDDEEKRRPEWISEPPTAIMSRETALPVAMYGRLFRESFWGRSGPFAKYGQQALKLSTHEWGGRVLKSQLRFLDFRPKELAKAYRNQKAAAWIFDAQQALVATRQYLIANYMMDLTESVVEADRMRRRLHYEKKVWPRTDKTISRHIDEIGRLQAQLPGTLNNYKAARAGTLGPGVQSVGDALGKYIEQGRLIMIEVREVQRLLGVEVQSLQYLVLGVVRQDDQTRQRLRNYMVTIRSRIQVFLQRRADEAIAAASQVSQQYITEIQPALPQQLDDNFRLATDGITAIFTETQSTLPSTRQSLLNLVETINACIGGDGGGALAPPPLDKFNLLADGSGLKPLRTRQRQFRALALEKMKRIKPRSSTATILRAWFQILERHPRLAGAATKEERDELDSEFDQYTEDLNDLNLGEDEDEEDEDEEDEDMW